MRKTITVKVTAEDIAEGQPLTCRYCPIALAVRRALGADLRTPIQVTPAFISHYVGSVEHIYELPPEARDFIIYFDRGYPGEPFEFELEVSGV
tara:strand:- start:16881 stop:17159 length:279 start_codon:yes stop_codon:yes gene_type:complete